jgi:hypothetical protein
MQADEVEMAQPEVANKLADFIGVEAIVAIVELEHELRKSSGQITAFWCVGAFDRRLLTLLPAHPVGIAVEVEERVALEQPLLELLVLVDLVTCLDVCRDSMSKGSFGPKTYVLAVLDGVDGHQLDDVQRRRRRSCLP